MIAIIGGGISGLAAAFELSQRGLPFRLFEASSRAGGLIRTEHRDGFTIDAAADSMLAAKPGSREPSLTHGPTSAPATFPAPGTCRSRHSTARTAP